MDAGIGPGVILLKLYRTGSPGRIVSPRTVTWFFSNLFKRTPE